MFFELSLGKAYADCVPLGRSFKIFSEIGLNIGLPYFSTRTEEDSFPISNNDVRRKKNLQESSVITDICEI